MMAHHFLRFAQKLSLAFWVGEMLFFIVIFAPRVFKVLERPMAAQLQAAIFPPYYLAGTICGVILISAFAIDQAGFAPRRVPQMRFWWTMGLALFACAVFAYSRWVLTPDMTALQASLYTEVPDPAAREAFDAFHKQSVRLNGAALLALLALIFLI